jgi:hypothetical protein
LRENRRRAVLKIISFVPPRVFFGLSLTAGGFVAVAAFLGTAGFTAVGFFSAAFLTGISAFSVGCPLIEWQIASALLLTALTGGYGAYLALAFSRTDVGRGKDR